MVTKPGGTCPVMCPHHGQEPPGYLPPGLVTIPDNRPPHLKSSRKDSQVFNVFRGALAPAPGASIPNNHDVIPLLFFTPLTFPPFFPRASPFPSPCFPSTPPFRTAICDLTCACLISLRRHVIYTQSRNSETLRTGRQQVCKHRPRSMNAAFAQGSGERKSPSGARGRDAVGSGVKAQV